MENCPNEGSVLDGKKSYCVPWKCWTNCREVGHCVREWWQKREKTPQQPSLFDDPMTYQGMDNMRP